MASNNVRNLCFQVKSHIEHTHTGCMFHYQIETKRAVKGKKKFVFLTNLVNSIYKTKTIVSQLDCLINFHLPIRILVFVSSPESGLNEQKRSVCLTYIISRRN